MLGKRTCSLTGNFTSAALQKRPEVFLSLTNTHGQESRLLLLLSILFLYLKTKMES